MKKKSLIAILLAMAMCFSLSACGDKSSESNESANSISETWSAALDAATSSSVKNCSKATMFTPMCCYTGINGYIAALKEDAPDNEFTKVLEEEYNKIDIDSMSDLEKDLVDVIFTYIEPLREPTSTLELGKGWVVGYNNIDANSDYRLIVMETIKTTSDGEKIVKYAGAGIGPEGEWWSIYAEEDFLKEYTGIEVSKESGKCNYFEEEGIACEYTALDSELASNVYTEILDMFEFLTLYYHDVFLPSESKDNDSSQEGNYDPDDPYYSSNDHDGDGNISGDEFQDALNDAISDKLDSID